MLHSKHNFDKAYFRYIRENVRLPINQIVLSSLNSSFLELTPAKIDIAEKPADDKMIVFPQNQVITEQDSLDAALSYISYDYKVLTKLVGSQASEVAELSGMNKGDTDMLS